MTVNSFWNQINLLSKIENDDCFFKTLKQTFGPNLKETILKIQKTTYENKVLSFQKKQDLQIVIHRLKNLNHDNKINYLINKLFFQINSIQTYRSSFKQATPDFFDALDNKNIDKIKYFLQKGINPNLKDENGNSILINILLNNSLEFNDLIIIDLLLEHGANPNLINHYDAHPLFVAINKENIDLMKLLLNYGANPNALNSLGYNALYEAMFTNDPLIYIKLLIKYGADPTVANPNDGMTLLHLATTDHYLEIWQLVSSLIQVDICNHHQQTPLHFAAFKDKDNKAIIEFLLKKGAQVNFRDKEGRTPLHFAAIANNQKICDLLIQYGANINNFSFDGFSPFLEAMAQGSKKLSQYLYHLSSPECQALLKHKMITHRFSLDVILKEGEQNIDLSGFDTFITYPELLHSLQNTTAWLNEAPSSWKEKDTKTILKAVDDAKYHNVDSIISHYKNRKLTIIPTELPGHANTMILFKDCMIQADRSLQIIQDEYTFDRPHLMIYEMKKPLISNEEEEWEIKTVLKDLIEGQEDLIENQDNEDKINMMANHWLSISNKFGANFQGFIEKKLQHGNVCSWVAAKEAFEGSLYLILYDKFLEEGKEALSAQQEAKIYTKKMYKAWVKEDLFLAIQEYIKDIAPNNPYKLFILACIYKQMSQSLKKIKIPIFKLIKKQFPDAVQMSQQISCRQGRIFQHKE